MKTALPVVDKATLRAFACECGYQTYVTAKADLAPLPPTVCPRCRTRVDRELAPDQYEISLGEA